jgi:Metallo-beta-lactamase superfamily
VLDCANDGGLVVRQVIAGVRTWSVFADDRGLHFNGFAVETSEGTLLVDPVDPSAAGEKWSEFDALAPYLAVCITNRNHSRAASEFRSRYGIPVRLHEADAAQAEVDAGVPGKSPGELAVFLPTTRALVVGDLVVGEGGELATYPEDVIDDLEELHRSAAKLLDLDFDALLLCDGEPFATRGKDALSRFVEQHRGG